MACAGHIGYNVDMTLQTTIGVGAPAIADAKRRAALIMIAVLIAVGLMTLAAVQSNRLTPERCKAFTIGQSAIGSCDWIGATP